MSDCAVVCDGETAPTDCTTVPDAKSTPTDLKSDGKSASPDAFEFVGRELIRGGCCKFSCRIAGVAVTCVSKEQRPTAEGSMWKDLWLSLSALSHKERLAVAKWCQNNGRNHYALELINDMFGVNVVDLQTKIAQQFTTDNTATATALDTVQVKLTKALQVKEMYEQKIVPFYQSKIADLNKQASMELEMVKFYNTGKSTIPLKELNMAAFVKWTKTVLPVDFRRKWDMKWVEFSTPDVPQLEPSFVGKRLAGVDAVVKQIISTSDAEKEGLKPHHYVYDGKEDDLMDFVTIAMMADKLNQKPTNGNQPCCIQ